METVAGWGMKEDAHGDWLSACTCSAWCRVAGAENLVSFTKQREAGSIRSPFKAPELEAISLCWASGEPNVRGLKLDVWILSLKCLLLFPFCRWVNWKGQECAKLSELPAMVRLPLCFPIKPLETRMRQRMQSCINLQGTRLGCKNTETVSKYLKVFLEYMVSHEHRILNGQRLFNRSNFSCETTGVTGIGFAPNCLIQQDISNVQKLCSYVSAFGHRERGSNQHEEKLYGFKYDSVLIMWVETYQKKK